MSYPDDNPKTAVGVTKAPLHLVPPVATHFTALAFKDGAAKYGPYNWREHRVSASVYYAAALRHLSAWWDGQNEASDSGVHHLGHVMACMAILLDAESVDKLNDDRPIPGAAAALQSAYVVTPTANVVVSATIPDESTLPPEVEALMDAANPPDPSDVLNNGKAHEGADE